MVFNVGYTIWTLNLNDKQLREVADVHGKWYSPGYGFHADVSSDGSRIVYSTCEYGLDEPPSGLEEYAGENVYEIAVMNVDGAGRRRLTATANFDGYPSWSPDGAHVAFPATKYIGWPESYSPYTAPVYYYQWPDGFNTTQLVLISVETGAMRWIDTTRVVLLHPPAWSPDGQRLAFLAGESESYALHTIGVDGEQETSTEKLSWGTAPPVSPSWSPDGSEIAFAAVEGGEAVLYAVMPDGTGLREVWRSEASEIPSLPIAQVAWSPDGSDLLFVTDRVYVVGADGSSMRPLSPDLPGGMGAIRAAWSPDGSRVAVYYTGTPHAFRDYPVLLATVSQDGTDLRALVGRPNRSLPLRVLNAPPSASPVDLAACSVGVVIPDPESNPGLVQDCEVLLSIRDRLAGDAELNWDEDTPIAEWEGVRVVGEPARVLELALGSVSILSGRPEDALSGTLPPELGRLSELWRLDLTSHYLSGGIPPELGALSKLRSLNLNGNLLSGPIPPELGRLTGLQGLGLKSNFLTGCVPTELPEIWVTANGLERCAE